MTNNNFELLKEKEIPELNTYAKLYRHNKTGAQVLSLINDDENKCFGINFRTPPTDSTGLPHIMEHSVLCGSRKYPLKEPFIELAKGSLNTFLNAFTYPDRTCYPVASQNLQDFYNLVDVYLDSVFYPRITPQVLQQEGWHFELDDKTAPLTYRGVVYNEMKGNYSSPENMLFEYAGQQLLPDTTYGVDSGGDPAVIPELTYEQFKQFHEDFYHPSNAYIFFYGDDDPAKRLDIIEAYLQDFEAKDPRYSEIGLQTPFSQPKQVVYPYAAGEDDTAQQKSYLKIDWLLPENNNVTLELALSILSHALLQTPASPVRKALLDSGLGEDVIGGGMTSYRRQMSFSVGLRGFKRADTEAVERLILDTLTQIAADGLEPDMVEAAVNTIEFRLREYNTGGFPRGLALMVGVLSTWINGCDPIEQLQFEASLSAVKENLATQPRYFEGLIETYLLQNPHRVTVVMEPDAELQARREAEETAKLADIKANLSDEQLEQIMAETRLLREAQETPDPPEALALVPSLQLSDIERENKVVPIEIIDAGEYKTLYHDIFTTGIVYLEVAFNLHGLPQDLLPYADLFSIALFEIGTETEDYVKLSQRIGRKTGGVRAYQTIMSQFHAAESAAWLLIRGKAMEHQTDDLLGIIRDVLLTVKLDNQQRFRQLVLEEKARFESGLIPGGHRVVSTRLRANFSEAGWVNEQLGGVSYLLFLRQLAHDVDNDWPSVLAKLEQVWQRVINRQAAVCNVTVDRDSWHSIKPKLDSFMAELPSRTYTPVSWTHGTSFGSEGLTAAGAQVNYVGKAANLYELGYRFNGSLSVITNYLRTTYLWEKIRMQGGAYGAFCSFDRNSGVFTYLSYRDPNLLATLTNYDQAAAFLRQVDLNEDQLTKSIIGVIGDIDTYRLPDAKGYTSLMRYLTGYTDEQAQRYREEVLATTPQAFREFAEVLAAFNEQALVGVLGSPETVKAANEQQGGQWTITAVK